MDLQFRTPTTNEEWDKYVLELANYSFLLSSARYKHIEESTQKAFRYLIFEKQKFIGVVTGAIDSIKIFGKYLECKHNPMLVEGLSDEYKGNLLREIFRKLNSIAVENNCFFVRVSPLILYDEIYDKVFLEFKAKKSPVHAQDALISQYFDMSKSEEELKHDMSSSTRNNINKLLKNDDISVRVVHNMSEFDTFANFYNQTKELKGYRGKSSESLRKELQDQEDKGMLYFVIGYYKEKPIAVWQNSVFGKYMHVYQAGSDVKFREKNIRITYLLFWESVKLAKELGIESLDLFGGMLPEGLEDNKNPWKGINDFKMSLGGHKVTCMHPRDIPLKQYYSLYLPYARFRVELKGHTINW